MNPMYDKLYRDCRANEISREVARETRITAALQTERVESASPARSVRSGIQQWLATVPANAMAMVRRFSASASRPA